MASWRVLRHLRRPIRLELFALVSSSSASAPDRHGQARLAGLFYCLVVVTGTFSLGWAPERLFVGETLAERYSTLAAQEPLLHAVILAELACYVAFIGTAVALHRLLAPSGGFAAAMMAVLALVSVPFGFSNVAHLLEIVRLLDAPLTAAGMQAVVDALERYRAGFLIQSIPWGLWLIPLGWLTIRCGFLPGLVGLLLILAGLGYVTHFCGRLVIEDWRATIWPRILGAPRVSEIILAVWLLTLGARRLPWQAASLTPTR
jgi:hypothetical protein